MVNDLKVSISDLIANLLEKKYIYKIFYVPGGAAFHLINALVKNKNISLIPMLHEQACVIAAEAYFRNNGKIAGVLVTAGPGISNCSTGILSCFVDRIPCVVISGQAQSKYIINKKLRIHGPQAISARSLYNNISNEVLEVEVDTHYEKIFSFFNKIDHLPYGPRIIQIPLDLQNKILAPRNLNFIGKASTKKLYNKNYFNKVTKEIVQYILDASNPCILLGGGVRCDSIKSIFNKFNKKHLLPILLSWSAKDLVNHSNINFAGLPGYFCNRSANATLYMSDLIVVIGSRFDFLQHGYQEKKILDKKNFIFIDLDIDELKKNNFKNANLYQINGIDFLENFLQNKNTMNQLSKNKRWINFCHSLYVEYVDEMVPMTRSKKHINPFYLIQKLSDLSNIDIFVAGSSGGSAETSFLNLKNKANKFINSPGLGSMGFAIPSIVGSIVENSSKNLICVVGDGGLQMNIQELATISSFKKSRILIIILNNDGYDSMRRSLKRYFNIYKHVDSKSGLTFPDLKLVSKAYNFKYYEVSSELNLSNKLNKIWTESNCPTILNVKTQKNVDSYPKIAPKMNKDGSISSGLWIDIDPYNKKFTQDLQNFIKEDNG